MNLECETCASVYNDKELSSTSCPECGGKLKIAFSINKRNKSVPIVNAPKVNLSQPRKGLELQALGSNLSESSSTIKAPPQSKLKVNRPEKNLGTPCVNCGADMAEEAILCINCGHRIDGTQVKQKQSFLKKAKSMMGTTKVDHQDELIEETIEQSIGMPPAPPPVINTPVPTPPVLASNKQTNAPKLVNLPPKKQPTQTRAMRKSQIIQPVSKGSQRSSSLKNVLKEDKKTLNDNGIINAEQKFVDAEDELLSKLQPKDLLTSFMEKLLLIVQKESLTENDVLALYKTINNIKLNANTNPDIINENPDIFIAASELYEEKYNNMPRAEDKNVTMAVCDLFLSMPSPEGLNFIGSLLKRNVSSDAQWPELFEQLSYRPDISLELIAQVGEKIPNSYAGLAYCDIVNKLALVSNLVTHPFNSPKGYALLESWLENGNVTFVKSATTTLAFLPDCEEVSKLNEMAENYGDDLVYLRSQWSRIMRLDGAEQALKNLIQKSDEANMKVATIAFSLLSDPPIILRLDEIIDNKDGSTLRVIAKKALKMLLDRGLDFNQLIDEYFPEQLANPIYSLR